MSASPFVAAWFLQRRRPTVDVRRFDPDFTRIRCPKCEWRPKTEDRWMCFPGCQHHWNTFETAGVCPSCQKQWAETACLRCTIWSPHAEWYVDGRE
jgi:hypothetical protein